MFKLLNNDYLKKKNLNEENLAQLVNNKFAYNCWYNKKMFHTCIGWIMYNFYILPFISSQYTDDSYFRTSCDEDGADGGQLLD